MDPRSESAARPVARTPSRAALPGWLLVAVLVVPLSVGFLGTRGLGEPDEGRYVAVARAMAESGDWLTPTLHGRPHLTKPPVTYWLVAGGLALRADEWGARAFLGLVHVLLALVVARLGARMAGGAEGRVAGLVVATMLMPFAAASLVTPDALLTLLIAAALAIAWDLASGAITARAARARALLFWLLVGTAFLVKGPPALLAPAIVLAFAVASGEPAARSRLRALAAPLAVSIGVAVGASWYAVAAVQHPGLLRHWLEVELVGRTIADAHGRNAGWHQPFKLFLPALLAGTLPWSLAWPLLAVSPSGAPGRPASRARAFDGHAARDGGTDAGARLARRFAWSWAVVPFVVFTLARSRGMLYVLPAFPALALLTTGALLARARARDVDARRAALGLLAACVLAGAALLGVRAVVANAPSHRDGRAHARLLAPHVLGPEDALVVVGRPLHSLEQYLDRDVDWRPVGRPPTRAWPPPGPETRVLADLFARDDRVVVVASLDVAARVEAAARESGRDVERHSTGLGREIFVAP